MVEDDELSVIDWTNAFETFCRQEDDLFSFLWEYAAVKTPTSLKRLKQ